MPNTNSKQYLVFIATNSNTYRDSVAKTFKIVGTHPSIPVFTQKDTNSYIVKNLTDNDQIFIQNYSDLQVDITTATPFRGSTIKKYIVINGSNTKTYTSSGVKDIGKVQEQQLQVIIEDSRGNRSQWIRQLDYIPYTQPIIQNFNLDREIGTSTSADFKTNGLYTAVDFGAVNNSITKVEYRSKTTGEYGSWTDITGLVLYGSGTFNNSTNTQLTGFTFGTAYTVELKVTDKLGFNTLTTTVSKGIFTMLIDQEYGSVGIGDIPKQEDNSLSIAGNIYAPNMLNYGYSRLKLRTNFDIDFVSKTINDWVIEEDYESRLDINSTGFKAKENCLVEISGTIYVRHFSDMSPDIYIRVNSEDKLRLRATLTGSGDQSITIPVIKLKLNKNDQISIYMTSTGWTSGDRTGYLAAGIATLFQVDYIKKL